MGFKDNLKSELKYQDVQLKDLAEKTGISKNTLGNYLTGHSSIPNAEVAVKIAQALNVSVEYLVTGKDFKNSSMNLSYDTRALLKNIEGLDSVDQNSIRTLVTAMKKRYTE